MSLKTMILCRVIFFLKIFFVSTMARPQSIDDNNINQNTNKTLTLLVNNQQPYKPEVTDDALFLTPYIEKGQIQKAQQLATVTPMIKDIQSFSGYLTVNKTAGSNLFFWLFKSQQGNWEQRPLLIWLQGGPGGSGLTGLFTELGPFSVTKDQKLQRRQYSWNQKYNLVFFDQPVGTGFSFTKLDSGYAKDQKDVADDLYEAIVQLYKLFPNLQKNKLFITGESYAGKYVPAIAYKIYKMNKISAFKITVNGLLIGNGATDPPTMLDYASYVYKLGLVDRSVRDELTALQEQTKAEARTGQYKAAQDTWDKTLDIVMKTAGISGFFDFVHDHLGEEGPEVQFINDPKTKKAIHVGTNKFHDSSEVHKHLDADQVQSVKPWVEELLSAEEYPIMFYSGQLDIIVAYVLSVEFYNSLQWPYAKEYYDAKRCQFKVGEEVAGYYKTAGTFTEMLVRNAGHLVPTSQPKWAFELMDRFVTNSASYRCE